MSQFPCRITFALIAIFLSSGLTISAEPVGTTSLTGSITSAASQSDGKLLIAGPFSSIGTTPRAGIARLESDGSLDLTFDPGMGANGPIGLLAVQQDGKVVMAGDFTAVAGTMRNRIARLDPDGTLDQSFNPGAGPNDGINALLIGADGKSVLGGRFEMFNGLTRHFLARLNQDGSLDATFDAGRYFAGILPQGVTDIAFYPDGRLIVAGFFTAQGKSDLVRVAADGTVDQSLPNGLSIQGIAVQPDGKIYVSGYVGPNPSPALRRFYPDGTLDNSFRPAPARFREMLRVQPDGKLLSVGTSGPIVRFSQDGSIDSSFGPVQAGSSGGTGSSFRALDLRPDGRIILAGTFDTVNGSPRSGVVRLFQNGQVDPSFVPEAGIVTVSTLGLNLSTRVAVGAGDDALIAGFIIEGVTAKRIMIRAIGPSLAGGNAPVPGPLADPVVELRDGRVSLMARNDNWRRTEIG
ncbi:MAG: large repetitive protein [Verrucomicrobiota bacterium]